MSGVFSIDRRFHGSVSSLLRLKLRDFTFMPRRAVPASPGGERCRPASRSWRAPAPCQSCARSDRPARSAAPRIHARYERVSGSWRGSLALRAVEVPRTSSLPQAARQRAPSARRHRSGRQKVSRVATPSGSEKLSPVVRTKANGSRRHSPHIRRVTAAWAGDPVPQSPFTANRTVPASVPVTPAALAPRAARAAAAAAAARLTRAVRAPGRPTRSAPAARRPGGGAGRALRRAPRRGRPAARGGPGWGAAGRWPWAPGAGGAAGRARRPLRRRRSR